MGKYAWVTLATNDSYSLGALVVAYSLKRVQTAHELAVLVTVGVSDSMKKKLSNVFDLVEEVNVLDSQDSAHLALLSRPELGVTFTKLHCWRLTQYEKCVFLDADTLILLNCDELFEREELSAAPDVGWPDCFNSGVFVYRPNLETYDKLLEFAVKDGSFDGGDQGLLNSYFSDWSTKDISKHLPFIYNTTTTAVYSYIPAFKKFGENVKILHFIGKIKPWLQIFDSASKTVRTPEGYHHVAEFLQFWWNIFCDDIHPQLSPDMNLPRSIGKKRVDTTPWYEKPSTYHNPPNCFMNPAPTPNNMNPINQISYYDPWEDLNQNNYNNIDNINQNIENNNNNNNISTNNEYNDNNNYNNTTENISEEYPTSHDNQYNNNIPNIPENNPNNSNLNNNNAKEINVPYNETPSSNLIEKSNLHVTSNSVPPSKQQNDKNQKNDYDAKGKNKKGLGAVDKQRNSEVGIY